MHILLIHQAFVALDEAGGTRHYELALQLAERGHRVTVIASPVSYLTGRTRSGAEKAGQAGAEKAENASAKINRNVFFILLFPVPVRKSDRDRDRSRRCARVPPPP